MSTLHACHVIHSLGAGGAEQVLVDLATVSAGADLRISVVGLVDAEDPGHARALREVGVEVHGLGLSSRWDPRAFARAARVVRGLAPDVVHTHLKHADLVGAVVARRLGLPQVSTLHLIEDSVSGLGAVKRRLAGEVRRRVADRTIAVSEAQRRWYLGSFPADPARVVTLHNGVVPGARLGPGRREMLRRSLGARPDAVLAVNVAIMRPGKGHDDLLDAMALLPDPSPVVVVLVGDGPERERLERRVAASVRMRDRVRFAGYRDDVPMLLQAADLAVHPTHADALPTALIHALAASVPVVATDVGGVPEVVGDRAGVLLPAHAPGLLSGELRRLAADRAARARMGAAGRERFDRLFDARQWARSLRALYAEVVGTASAQPSAAFDAGDPVAP